MKRALFLALGTIIVMGCGSSNEGSCERIAEACHDKDTGSGKPHDCHTASESSTDDACAEIEADCLAACE